MGNNTTVQSAAHRKLELDRTCDLKDEHAYLGQAYYCWRCQKHGCMQHMDPDEKGTTVYDVHGKPSNELVGTCVGCRAAMVATRLAQEERSLKDVARKCTFDGHAYIGPIWRCTDCDGLFCEAHQATERSDARDDETFTSLCVSCDEKRDQAVEQERIRDELRQKHEAEHHLEQARTCERCRADYVGRAYRCEDCHRYTCETCTCGDAWDERVKDGVFLCSKCHRTAQIIADIG